MKRFIVLLILFAAGCMTAADSAKCEDDPKTIMIHDTLIFQDTITLIATPSDTPSIYGVWHAEYVSTWSNESAPSKFNITLAISRDALYPATFSATRVIESHQDATISGRINSIGDGVATAYWSGGYLLESGGDFTWALSFQGNSLYLQQIGGGFFAIGSAVKFTR